MTADRALPKGVVDGGDEAANEGAIARGALAARTAAVVPADPDLARDAEARLDALAIPPGALGDLGRLAVRLAASRGAWELAPPSNGLLLIAAGDHGVHAQGVTPWPQALSAALTSVLAEGDGAAGVMARANAIDLKVLDVGLATDPPRPAASLLARRVRSGTRDLSREDALHLGEVVAAVDAGAAEVEASIARGGDAVLLGDVGLANTTPSAALIAALTDNEAGAVTGRGSGIDDATLRRKRDVIATALRRHHADHGPDADAWTVLGSLGGLEHAALVGAILAAGARRVPIVLDGVVSGAAAMVAVSASPAVAGHLVAGHRSTEPAAALALDHLGLEPLLDLRMRVGEGTGALAAWPLVQQAATLLRDTATLADLGLGP